MISTRGDLMNGRRLFAGITLVFIMIAAAGMPGSVVFAAEGPQFILEVSESDIDSDSHTLMTLTMINAKGAKVQEIVGSNWFYIPPEGSSQTTRLYNGVMSYVETETYRVIPYYAGNFKLWAMIEYNGDTYMTNKIEINVTDNTSGGQQQKLYIDTMITDNEVYIGQKVALAYEVYSLYELSSLMFLEDVKIKDVLITGKTTEKLISGKIVLNGREYYKYRAEMLFMTPLRSGIFVVPGRDFFGYISQNVILSDDAYSQRAFAEPQELIVKPLPDQNQPEDFSWIIGELNIDAKYDTLNTGGGSSVRFTVTASGDCSLDGLNKIFTKEPSGFSVYEIEKRYEEKFEDNKYFAVKEFEITLIPKQKGTLAVDPVRISYFDTGSDTYKFAEIPGFTVTVGEDGKIEQEGETLTGADHTEGEQSGDDPAGEDQSGSDVKKDGITETIKIEQVSYDPQSEGYWTVRISKTVLLIIAIALPLVGAALFLMLKRPKKKNDELDDIYARLLKARDENDMYNHFNSMIRHCFGISLKACSRSEIAAGIQDERFADPILEIVEYVERERTLPGKADKTLLRMIKKVYKLLKQRPKSAEDSN